MKKFFRLPNTIQIKQSDLYYLTTSGSVLGSPDLHLMHHWTHYAENESEKDVYVLLCRGMPDIKYIVSTSHEQEIYTAELWLREKQTAQEFHPKGEVRYYPNVIDLLYIEEAGYFDKVTGKIFESAGHNGRYFSEITKLPVLAYCVGEVEGTVKCIGKRISNYTAVEMDGHTLLKSNDEYFFLSVESMLNYVLNLFHEIPILDNTRRSSNDSSQDGHEVRAKSS